MPVHKLKTLILLILAITAAFLLAIVVPSQLSRIRAEQHLQEQLETLFSNEGVVLDCTLPQSQKLSIVEFSAPADARETAEYLLGEDAEGDGSVYSSQKGNCKIEPDGSFSAQLRGSEVSADLTANAEKTLRAIGFSAASVSQPLRLSAGIFSISCRQSILGVPVFSEGMTLTYTNNCLTGLSGIFYRTDGEILRVGDEVCISCADALLALLSKLGEQGWVGSRITAVEQGYRYADSAAAAIRLAPYWRIVTDTGTFFVAGVGGEVSSAD